MGWAGIGAKNLTREDLYCPASSRSGRDTYVQVHVTEHWRTVFVTIDVADAAHIPPVYLPTFRTCFAWVQKCWRILENTKRQRKQWDGVALRLLVQLMVQLHPMHPTGYELGT